MAFRITALGVWCVVLRMISFCSYSFRGNGIQRNCIRSIFRCRGTAVAPRPSTIPLIRHYTRATVLRNSNSDIESIVSQDLQDKSADTSFDGNDNSNEFGADFIAPTRHDEDFLLDKLNAHEWDSRMHFDEASHKYYFDGVRLSTSVTSVVSSYFEKFVPEVAVQKMIFGSRWPRPEYTHEDGTPFTAEEVLLQWSTSGEDARNRGTWMHWNIERLLNHLPTEVNEQDMPEFKQFKRFHAERIEDYGVLPYRTEWRIAAPDLGLAGSVDFVGVRSDGGYVIMDWKRSKKLPTTMNSAFGKIARPPLSHLPDCDGSKYGLQLNLYRYMLRTYYNMDVRNMVLASFHPEFQHYFCTDIQPMDAEIDIIVEELRVKEQHRSAM